MPIDMTDPQNALSHVLEVAGFRRDQWSQRAKGEEIDLSEMWESDENEAAAIAHDIGVAIDTVEHLAAALDKPTTGVAGHSDVKIAAANRRAMAVYAKLGLIQMAKNRLSSAASSMHCAAVLETQPGAVSSTMGQIVAAVRELEVVADYCKRTAEAMRAAMDTK